MIKYILLFTLMLVGVLFGILPSLYKKKPLYWKIIAFLIFVIGIIISLAPPIAGSFEELIHYSNKIPNYSQNVVFNINNNDNLEDGMIFLKSTLEDKEYLLNYNELNKLSNNKNELYSAKRIVANFSYSNDKNEFIINYIVRINPIIIFPYIVNLGEKIRIINFHVPVAWISVFAYLISMIFSIYYLKTKELKYDIVSSSSAILGTLFCILATVTGMLWAKFNWGAYWNWDPRETSIFILLLIYLAYFSLRSTINDRKLKAKLSSVYSIIAFITVPFLIFVLPRITSGLHPGSADDNTIGPILSSADEIMNLTKQFTFAFSLMSYTILYFWILNLLIRIKRIEYERIS